MVQRGTSRRRGGDGEAAGRRVVAGIVLVKRCSPSAGAIARPVVAVVGGSGEHSWLWWKSVGSWLWWKSVGAVVREDSRSISGRRRESGRREEEERAVHRARGRGAEEDVAAGATKRGGRARGRGEEDVAVGVPVSVVAPHQHSSGIHEDFYTFVPYGVGFGEVLVSRSLVF